MKLSNYYFTFGRDERYPFQDGWVIVEAETLNEAINIFREHFPNRETGALNCADYYTPAQFYRTSMAKNGNFGARCHLKLNKAGIMEKGE